MEKGINKRFERILKELDMTPAVFSRKTGIKEATISYQRKKDSKPTLPTLDLIRKTLPEVNIDYLTDGMGEPLLDPDNMVREPDVHYEAEDIQKFIERLEEDIRVLRRKLDDNKKMLSILRKINFDV